MASHRFSAAVDWLAMTYPQPTVWLGPPLMAPSGGTVEKLQIGVACAGPRGSTSPRPSSRAMKCLAFIRSPFGRDPLGVSWEHRLGDGEAEGGTHVVLELTVLGDRETRDR